MTVRGVEPLRVRQAIRHHRHAAGSRRFQDRQALEILQRRGQHVAAAAQKPYRVAISYTANEDDGVVKIHRIEIVSE